MMERRRSDTEGGRVVHRGKRTTKLALVVALQNLLVVGCLVITLFVYWNTEKPTKQTLAANVHLQFDQIADVPNNKRVQFHDTHSSYKMVLDDKTKDKIYIDCTGPYLLYIEVCYKSLRAQVTNGTLQLRVERNQTLVTSIPLNTSDEVCKGLHSIGYLKVKEVAYLYLQSLDGFKVKNMTVGLSYLLGSRCEF